VAGSAGADDHDLRRRRDLRGLGRRQLAEDDDLVVLPLDGVAGDRVERRRAHRVARPEVEARVVPRTADGVADQQPLGERSRVVGAGGADGEHLLAPPREQDRLAVRVTEEQAAVGELGEWNALCQIRSLELCLR
jgi:hypothetical protein